MAFDLAKQDFEKAAEGGYEFELMLPTGAGSGAYLTVLGDMSPTVKAYTRRKIQEYQQKVAIAKRQKREVEDMSFEELLEQQIESALVRLKGYREIFVDGKELKKFSPENARELLQKDWIRHQVLEKAKERNEFSLLKT